MLRSLLLQVGLEIQNTVNCLLQVFYLFIGVKAFLLCVFVSLSNEMVESVVLVARKKEGILG